MTRMYRWLKDKNGEKLYYIRNFFIFFICVNLCSSVSNKI
jgi:hypothetical protein